MNEDNIFSIDNGDDTIDSDHGTVNNNHNLNNLTSGSIIDYEDLILTRNPNSYLHVTTSGVDWSTLDITTEKKL